MLLLCQTLCGISWFYFCDHQEQWVDGGLVLLGWWFVDEIVVMVVVLMMVGRIFESSLMWGDENIDDCMMNGLGL